MRAHPLTHRSLWRAVLAALVVTVLAVPPAAAAPNSPTSSAKSYAASVSAPTVDQGGGIVLTLLDCGPCGAARTSNQAFGSARVTLPTATFAAAYAVDHGWRVTDVSAPGAAVVTLQLVSGTGTPVAPGDAVRLALVALGTAPVGPVTVTTQVKQANDFSGSGNDFGRVGPEPALAVVARPLAVVFTQGPSPVQQTGSTASSTGVTPRYVMCPAPAARVTGGGGTPVPGVTVTLTSTAADGTAYSGLRQDGTPAGSAVTAVTDATGTATFGTANCAAGLRAEALGVGLSLTATVQSLADTRGTFPVLQVYGTCNGDVSCTSGISGPSRTQAQVVTSTAPTDDPLTFSSSDARGWQEYARACNPDVSAAGANPYRDLVVVDVVKRSKTLTMTWPKTAVQWATDNGASKWQVCFAVQYPTAPAHPFAAVGGPARAVGDGGWYVGALLPCGDAALAASDPCLRKLTKTGGGQQQAVALVPVSDGDPKMW